MAVTNAQRQRVRALQHRKWRRKYSAFAVEGIVNVDEVLRSDMQVLELYVTEEAAGSLQEPIATSRRSPATTPALEVQLVGEGELLRLSSQRTPHGAVAVVAIPQTEGISLSSDQLLYLDGVGDPGNVGTLLRSAEWFGYGGVLAGPNTADYYHPKVVAATRGSLFRLSHQRVAAPEVLAEAYPGHALVAADLTGEALAAFTWPRKYILVVGGESRGISEGISRLSPKLVTIPRVSNAPTESLNAGVAGSILMAASAKSL